MHRSKVGAHSMTSSALNKNFRVVCFFGAQHLVEEAATLLPKLMPKEIARGDNSFIRYRTEEPLTEEDDTLFEVEEEQSH
jgi:hypothetical protein